MIKTGEIKIKFIFSDITVTPSSCFAYTFVYLIDQHIRIIFSRYLFNTSYYTVHILKRASYIINKNSSQFVK